MIARPVGRGSELPYFGLNFAVVTEDTEELIAAFDKEEDARLFASMKGQKVKIRIGRTSGPCTDQVVESNFVTDEEDTIKDVLAIVNKVSGNKEGWFIQVGEEGPIVVPEVK